VIETKGTEMTTPSKTTRTKKTKTKWLVLGGVLLGATLGGLTFMVSDAPGAAPVAKRDEAPALTRLQQEASARFAGVQPHITLPDGKQLPPVNPAHALQMKVNAFQSILAKEAEERDPTFHLKAEAELERRAPMLAAITWDDLSGNREMDFTIEDSSACRLDGKTELSLDAKDVGQHPCLAQGGSYWEPDTKLKVSLTPIGADQPLWQELLSGTKKAMATEAHLAGLETIPGQGG
jgi:hypothetical protein